MMAQVAGFAIAFGALVWVVLPLFTERRAPSAGFCAECGTPLEVDAGFCAECGAPAVR